MKKIKIIVVYYGRKSTFIQRDINIFKKYFEVDEIKIVSFKDLLHLFNKIFTSDVIYVWFAGKHAGISVLLARLFRKKSIVVVGGYDAAYFPEIGYGLWAKGSTIDKLLAKIAIKYSTKVVAVSSFIAENIKKYSKVYRKDIEVIYNGIETNLWRYNPEINKKDIVITTAYINRRDRIKIKGIDIFIALARKFPNMEFRIIGIENNMKTFIETIIKKINCNNIKVLPPMSPEEILKNYQEAKIYCQLSITESFGISVVEAMSCGCIPVVTDRGALPEIVGDVGIIVKYGDMNSIVEGIKKAYIFSQDSIIINKIINTAKKFSLNRREKKLLRIIELACRDCL